MKKLTFVIGLCLLGALVASPTQASMKIQIVMSKDELLQKGKDAFHSGQLEKAALYYETAIYKRSLSDQDKVVALSDLCVTYMFLERYGEAIEMCEASLDLLPNRWETVNNLGTVFLVQGDYKNAIRQYERGLSMKPNSRVLKANKRLAVKRAEEASLEAAESDGAMNLEAGNPQRDHSSSF